MKDGPDITIIAAHARCQQPGWASRAKDPRVLAFSSAGGQALRGWCERVADSVVTETM